MALQLGNILTRHFGQNHLRLFTPVAEKLLHHHTPASTSRNYSKKSKSLTPTTEDAPRKKTTLETAKEVAAKLKEAKRKWDVGNPMNETAQPTLFEAQLPPRVIDIVIVGGGIMGSSIAYYLTRDGLGAGVLVIEKDPMVSFTLIYFLLSRLN